MFCCKCGVETPDHSNFCWHCGAAVKSEPAEVKTSTTKTLSFDAFKKRKEEERSARFQSKKSKSGSSSTPNTKGKQNQEVSINVGFMKFEDDKFKKCRGRALPVKVPTEADRKTILERSVRKHANHFRDVHSNLDYILLYPDSSEIVNLPGTTDEFVLNKYKEDVGRNYNRVTFFIATKTDYQLNRLSELGAIPEEEESDWENEQELNHCQTKWKQTTLEEINEQGAKTKSNTNSSVIVVSSSSDSSTNLSVNEREPSSSEHSIQCPTCFELFSVHSIAQHADACIDVWIGDVEYSQDDTDSDLPNPGLDVHEEVTSSRASLMSVAQKLADDHIKKENQKRLNVRRKHLWVDFKQAHAKCKLDPSTPIRVVFLGEPAIDDGGPKREFFTEMLEYIETKLFCNGKPISSIIALQNEEFKLAGELMVISILQNGPAPALLHQAVFNFISNQQLSIEDIPESDYKTVALQIMAAKSDDELHAVLVLDNVLTVLEEIGYSGVPHRETLKSAMDIVQSICVKSQLGVSIPQLMQLQQGLTSCGVLSAIRRCPNLWALAFVSGICKPQSPDKFLDELEAKYSQSQLLKEKEVDVFKYFCEFVQSLDSSDAAGGSSISGITLSDLLKWMSGCKTTPVLGFSKRKSLMFVHGCNEGCRCRPTTSTCDLSLKLPVHITDEDDMKYIMNSALKDSCGFGFL